MAADPKVLLARYDNLTKGASNHFIRCENMAPYLSPSRMGIISQRSPGQSNNANVMDSTMMNAAELMAMFICGHVINPAQRWGDMRMKTPGFRNIDAIREWQEDSRDRMLAVFAESAFYGEAQECAVDWAGFGTGCLMAEEAPAGPTTPRRGFRGMHFAAHKTGRFVMADGPTGQVDTLFYELKMSAGAMEKRFGLQNLPEKIKNALSGEQPKRDELYTIVHAITPRADSDRTYAAGNKNMPWASCWIEKETKHLLAEGGYRRFPGAVPRYLRTPGETFGRGRGDLAYPDAWTLNEAKRMGLEDWTLKIKPPVLVRHDSVIGTLKLVPGAPTSINTHGKGIRDAVAPWETGSHPEVSHIKEEELRKSIRTIFFVEQILMLMEVNKSEMTAFEFAKKLELLFRIMGTGIYGRFEQEFLRPIWDITFYAMFEAGALAPMPPEMLETDGALETVFENPIAKSQRTTDMDAVNLAAQDMLPLSQAFPQMLDRWDPDRLASLILMTRGVPASVQRNDDEMAAYRKAKADQQAQEMQMEQAGQIAEAGGKIAPLLTALQGGKT